MNIFLIIILPLMFIAGVIAYAIIRTAPKEEDFIPEEEEDEKEYFEIRRYFEEQL